MLGFLGGTGEEGKGLAFRLALAGESVMIGSRDEARAVEAAAETNLESTRRMAREVGIPACSAFLAFAEERYTDAVELLLSIRTIAHRFGGSHAQRDILTQTLIESAIRAHNIGLASNLISERTVHKPFSPLTRRFNARIIVR